MQKSPQLFELGFCSGLSLLISYTVDITFDLRKVSKNMPITA